MPTFDRAAAKAAAQALIDDAHAALARGAIGAAEWQRRVSDALAASYLGDDDPRWQCGFDGDADLWREARGPVLIAVAGDGSLLDVGCANGHLMECLHAWARERGVALAPHGLELSPALADAARRRLPAWAGRIHTGNAVDWVPPQRYGYVRTSLEYVPPGGEPALVARLLRDVVAPGGRLIVGPLYEADVPRAVCAFAGAGIAQPSLAGATDRNGKTRYVAWASAAALGAPELSAPAARG